MQSGIKSLLLITGLLLTASSPLYGDDGDALRKRLEDEHAEGAKLWIYNDLAAAMAQAKAENKPLFVTFRCVPCEACAGFDAEVAQGSEQIEKLAREQFVSVRQVEMKGVDLSLFQFDYDLNWAAMFINADGVVYARYGTQSAAGPDAYNSIEGLRNTMQRVLQLHEAYPLNKAALAGKRGAAKPYRTALEMPGLERKEERRGRTTRRNCIHCHNIHDAETLHAQQTGKFTHDMLWRFPLPDNLGLTIDARHGLRVREVRDGSPAARAGLQPGEDIVRIGGQPMTSIADMQWALHNLPNTATRVRVRGSQSGDHELQVAAGWKQSDISWRGSMWSVQPRLRVWAPALKPEQRKEHGIPADQTALLVRWINRGSPGGKSAFAGGLREGDVILRLADQPVQASPQQFNLHIKLNYEVGDELPLTIRRDGVERKVAIKLVE